jgi:hypothetical protein
MIINELKLKMQFNEVIVIKCKNLKPIYVTYLCYYVTIWTDLYKIQANIILYIIIIKLSIMFNSFHSIILAQVKLLNSTKNKNFYF